MRKLFSTANWPFAFKFSVPSFLAFFLVCVIEIVALNALSAMRDSLSDVVERKYNASLLLEQCTSRLRFVNEELYLIQTKKAAGIDVDVNQGAKDLSRELELISDNLAKFKSTYARPEDIPQVESAMQNVRQYRKAVSFVGSMLDIDFKATVNFIIPLRGAYEEMIVNLSSVSNQFLMASREASVKADQLAKARTVFIVVFTSVVLILSLSIMLPLAYSTTQSIKALAAATIRLADGDTRIDLGALVRRDELGRIVTALTIFRDNIERVETLQKVSLLYASMNAMLNTLKDGLLTFGPDGICSENFSTACLDLLKQTPKGVHIADLLNMPFDERAELESLLNLVFVGSETFAMSPQSVLDMLPRFYYERTDRLRKGETAISLDYKPILTTSGDVQSVLVIATDHSEEIAAEKLNQEKQLKIQRTLRILSSQNMFVRFFSGITEFFSQPEKLFGDTSLEQIKRDVHTFKGVAGIYYLDKIAHCLHQVEEVLPVDEESMCKTDSVFMGAILSLNNALKEARSEISEILGPSFDKQGMMRTLPLDSLKELIGLLPEDEIFEQLRLTFTQRLMGESIQNLLSNTVIELRELADRYGKKLNQPKIEGEDFLVLSENYASVLASLTHISRNIIKHGVEDPETRQEYGKPEYCSVTIRTEKFKYKDKDWFRLEFHDDGGGIDVNKLKRLPSFAANKNLEKASHEELLQLVFEGNASTSQEVNALGGRGVGMSAIKQAVEEIGGTVRVESTYHLFTKTILELPLVWAISA